jgi:hypothetical protein
MGKPQIRLEKDVAGFVLESAKDNSRTPPAEVNHVLRLYYNQRKSKARNLASKAGGPVVTDGELNAAVRKHSHAGLES